MQANQITPNNTQDTQPRRPANPPARFAFRQKKTANQTDKGARAQTTKPTKRICQGTQRTLPLCHTQKHA